MTLLEVISISKSFAGTPVLHDVSFQANRSEIVCLLGPSGCGKTTLLRIVAGLETADSGRVTFDGHSLDAVPAHHRGFGLMFQDYALFPHKDVAANVAFGLQMQALPRRQVEARVAEMLALVGMEGYERRQVYDLSGGEQQRVALARSLAPDPRLLMLDEPLGSLDRALREELMNELRTILKRVEVTAIYVTHDQEEAFAVADKLVIMKQGRIVQQGPPQAIFHRPASPWVARFLGLTNLIPARVVDIRPLQVDTALGRLTLTEEVAKAEQVAPGQQVTLLIRPEAAHPCVEPAGTDKAPYLIHGLVHTLSFRGGYYRVVVRHASGTDLAFELALDDADLPQPENPITLALHPEAMSLLTEKAHE